MNNRNTVEKTKEELEKEALDEAEVRNMEKTLAILEQGIALEVSRKRLGVK
ncbi:MAG: hypothetical protein FWB90_10390 [Fibromonadales bacterium]|nr:hypothetical protein [Fibromonadales bacterium]